MAATGPDATRIRWYNSLIVRVMALCGVLVLCLLGAVYFLTGNYYRQVVQEIEQRAADVADSVKIQLDARPEFELEAEDLPENFEIPEEGRPIDLRLIAGEAGPDTVVPQVSAEGYFFMATQTFQLNDGRWVELTVQVDMDPQTEVLRAFKNRYLMIVSAVFLFTLGLMIYLIAKSLRPLRSLTDSCAEISEGQLRDVKAGGGSGEILALENTFNRMVSALREKEVVEANLRQAQRLSAIGNLAAGVAHDVRNPLNAIKLLSGQALDELESEPDHAGPARALETIRNEVGRLEDIVSGFLSLAKEEELRRELRPIDPIVEECLSLIENDAKSREVRLTSELRVGDTALMVDSKHMARAILNVLINAMESCPAGGRVRVFSRTSDRECEIEVRDDGPGMPLEVLEQVFDPYFTTKPTGTGLGLSITRGIVEEHGGKVRISSSEGAGCQVLITLPLGGDGGTAASG